MQDGKMGRTALLSVVLLTFSTLEFSQGLECWQCSASTSDRDCKLKGSVQTCGSDEDVCGTVVRRFMGISMIWKQCKQKQACWNDREQNWDKYGSNHQCNNNLLSSVCYCCCGKDSCNAEQSCTGQITARTCSAPRQQIENGQVYCTNGNRVGSQCHYSCTKSGYYLNPSDSTTSQCMENGQWSKKAPCCSLPCPPYAPFDVVWLINKKHKERVDAGWGPLGRAMYRLWQMGKENYRDGRVFYTGEVIPELGWYLNNSLGILNWVMETTHKQDQETDDLVNTGNALRYAREKLFASDARNAKHSDVMVLITDRNSDDDVKEAAQALRDEGILTYVIYLKVEAADEPNMQQILDVAGEPDHVFIVEGDIERVSEKIAKELIGHVCDNIC